MGFGAGFDISADAAVVEQLHIGFEQFVNQHAGRQAFGFGAQPGFHFGAELDAFHIALIHAAALGNQGAVVLIPAGHGIKQALALGKARGGIGIGVDKDVAVVEGGFEADVAREQHAVAKHIAAHVADAHHGEIFVLNVFAQVAEMAFHRFPRAAGGDAHAFVVVAGGAAGSEGIIEPEAVLLSNAVGHIGEAGGAFVGGHHQIGVVFIAALHIGRRDNIALLEVVGEIEQRVDENLIASHAFGGIGFALTRRRQLFAHKAAFGAVRHNHGVFHHLRFHQAQHFGAEIFHAVRPAQAAARHFGAAQMRAFHARAVYPDFKQRMRLGQKIDLRRADFEADVLLGLALGIGLPEIGALNRQNHRHESIENAVFIKAGHIGQLRFDGRLKRFGAGFVGVNGMQAGVKQRHQIGHNRAVAH